MAKVSTNLKSPGRGARGSSAAEERGRQSLGDLAAGPPSSQRSSQRAPRRRSGGSNWLTDPAAQYSLLPTREVEEPEAEEGAAACAAPEEPHELGPFARRVQAIQEQGVEVLESTEVQIASACMIMLNAVVIGLETDIDWIGWNWVENLFLIFFTTELAVRMLIITPKNYFACQDNPELVWNLFDFTIVSMGLVDFCATVLAPNGTSPGGFATVFRIIRLCRILRMFRIIRFLKQLYLLAYGFVEAALAIVWVTILMTFVLYVCGIVLARLYGKVPSDDPDFEFLSSHFGSVPGSMLTLFELMSSPDLASYQEVLVNRPSMLPFLIAFIIFGSFGMIALLTGVISECMFEKNKAKMDEERIEREAKRTRFQKMCSELFRSIDDRQNGLVTCEGLQHHKDEIVALLEGAGVTMTDNQLMQMFNALDTDANGYVDSLEFENGVMQMCEDIRPMSIMELHHSIRYCTTEVEGCKDEVGKRFQEMDMRLLGLAATMERIYAATVKPEDDTASAESAADGSPAVAAAAVGTPEPEESVQQHIPGGAASQAVAAADGAAEGATGGADAPPAVPEPSPDGAAGLPLAAALEGAPPRRPRAEVQPTAPAPAVAAVPLLAPPPPQARMTAPPEAAAPLLAFGEALQEAQGEPACARPEKGLVERPGPVEAVFAENPPPCSVEEFRGRLREMAAQVHAEVRLAEAASSRMSDFLALQAVHAAKMDARSEAFVQALPPASPDGVV